jgi:ribosome-associated toxin RatA of RatAB toxin-antitoxin module
MITSKYHHQFTHMPKTQRYIGIYFTLLFVFSFLMISQSVYAEKELVLKKTVNVNSQDLLETLSNIQNYPQIFPEYIKSVELTGADTAKFNVGSNGIFFDVKTKYTQNSDGSYVVEVTSGDLKGSKIITTLQKTWGFDGTPDGGTRVNIDMMLQTSGMLSLFAPSIPDQAILSNLGAGLDKFASYTKTKSETPLVLKDKLQIKNDARLWSKGAISDTVFVSEIQSIMKYGMIKSQSQQYSDSIQIPSWIKTDAVWWADGKISDGDFNSSIQYLIDNKIMKV